ncbi:hypothetical protein QEN19_002924 [Hanseniaspora menglaensis]
MGFFSSNKNDASKALNASTSEADPSLVTIIKMPLAENSESLDLPETYKESLPKLKKEYEKAEETLTELQINNYEHIFKTLNDQNFKLPQSLTAEPSWKNALDEDYEHPEWTILSSYEKFFLTRECIFRFLVGCKWDYNQTISKLIETIVWRREFGLTYDPNANNKVTCDLIEEENKSGKQVILGYDKNGSVLLYLKDGLQNTEPSQRQVQQMIFMIDQCVMLNPKYVTKVTILVDFKHYPEIDGVVKKRKMTPLHIAKQCLHICQTYYPETLGYAVFINIPWLGYALLKLITPLIDSNTKQRLVFDEPFTNRIDIHNLDYHYGGYMKFDYDHEVYWPDFKKKIESRREQNFSKWKELGGTIGIKEVEFKP